MVLHDPRHTHATHREGARNRRELADRLGHPDPTFTLRTQVLSMDVVDGPRSLTLG